MGKKNKYFKHNYVKQILKISEKIEGKPGIQIISVAHDNWCNYLKNNKKRCNCNPEVQKGVEE